ncbi:MAG TPA: hypothetical protein VGL45_05625, partial [Bradyrhizobium sp.]
ATSRQGRIIRHCPACVHHRETAEVHHSELTARPRGSRIHGRLDDLLPMTLELARAEKSGSETVLATCFTELLHTSMLLRKMQCFQPFLRFWFLG